MKNVAFSRVLAVLGLFATAIAAAQPAGDYPTRPLRLIVPQAAGGGLDTSTRVIAIKMAEQLGQPVIIENRASAGGIAGMEGVAKAAPDGYTLLMASATVALNTALGMKLPYDPERDGEEYAAFMKNEIGRWSPIVKAAGIKIE